MVRSGHAAPVAQFSFTNPERPRLGVEVLDLAELSSRMSPGTARAVHRTDFHQLFLFTAGDGSTVVDFVDHHCVPGTLLYIHPGRILRLPRATDGSVLDALVVLFSTSFAPPIEHIRPLLSPFGPIVWSVSADAMTSLRGALVELEAEYRRTVASTDSDAITVELLRQLLGVVLLRMCRLPVTAHPTGAEDVRGETFRRFQQEVERCFASTRNATHYAARVGYSLRSLNRACRAATGHNAKTLIDARVVLEARRLLVHTQEPIATVAHRLGFSEPTNFGKFFTRETGMSPGAFRDLEHGSSTTSGAATPAAASPGEVSRR